MPARAPTKLKLLRGTARKDRSNPREPEPKGPLPSQPPSWISPLARTWWTRVRPILIRLRVATSADPIAVGMLCDALAEYVSARTVIDKEGATYWTEGESRMLRARPEVAIAQDAWRRAKLMLTEYGMTAASRGKVGTADAPPADPLEQWKAGT